MHFRYFHFAPKNLREAAKVLDKRESDYLSVTAGEEKRGR
jgi:hypothetical protein